LSRVPVLAALLCILAVRPLAAQNAAGSVALGAAGFAQPGDQVRISVWPQSAFGPPITTTVDASGTIIVPPAGTLPVSTIPIALLRDTVRARLTKFIREPEVDVQVLRRVTVNGAVIKPDIYFMDVSATLRDAVARAGGITENGTRGKVSIVRDGVTTRVKNWETDTSERSVLRSGDQIVVGRRSWIEINIIPVASLSLATASFLLSLRK
jgi:protein involved in polysaccharide export with SLBB domain